jgi:ribosome-binding protein aMBF1 (putative translation factor)
MARQTSNALEILQRKIGNESSFVMIAAEEREKSAVARAIYKMRTDAGLSQADLAKRVGTTQSVIARLEDCDYTAHTFKMLRRIANAVNHDIQVSFVPRTLQKVGGVS